MEIFEREIEARERTDVAMPSKNFESSNYNNRFCGRHSGQGNYNQSHRPIQGTASAFLSNNSYPESTFSCTYCRGPHPSNSCKTVPSLEARRENLIKYRRCFICLKKDHISRNCNSIKLCPVCGRRHHVSICEVAHNQRNTNSSNLNPQASNFNPSGSVNQRQDNFRIAQRNNPSTCMYNNSKPTIGHRSLVLLQTARAQTSNTTAPSNKIWARIIMDNGSQRTYITSKLRDALKLQTISRQFVRIRTFGAMELIEQEVDIVNCVIHNKDNSSTLIQAYVIPLISHQL
ncbi:hypothetical protein SNE40_009524 [Patella caerulea]|uniref:Peptidase aspartic putative domain-containing protein n=1 Tax=Patella caerulea TaxID=87958 RepID=A0AAN8JNX0_PATCE